MGTTSLDSDREDVTIIRRQGNELFLRVRIHCFCTAGEPNSIHDWICAVIGSRGSSSRTLDRLNDVEAEQLSGEVSVEDIAYRHVADDHIVGALHLEELRAQAVGLVTDLGHGRLHTIIRLTDHLRTI